MDKPSIDDLLKSVGGIYDLATVAAKRAVDIKRKDKGSAQPLQRALDEISRGEVSLSWKNRPESGEQIELPLEVSMVPVGEDTEIIDEEIAEVGEELSDEEEEEEEAGTEVEEEKMESTEEEEEGEYTPIEEDIIEEDEFAKEGDEF